MYSTNELITAPHRQYEVHVRRYVFFLSLDLYPKLSKSELHPRYDQALDLACSLIYLGNLGISEVAFNR
jgi:hypothetical protein